MSGRAPDTVERSTWRSWLAIIAVVLGVLVVAHHGTELTRHAVVAEATPADGRFPPAACPADELEEEGLSLAECRQMVSNVLNYTLSSPPWFATAGVAAASVGVLAGGLSIVSGVGLLGRRRWPIPAAATAFATLAAVDAAVFVAAVNAGPILRDLYLWDGLVWLTLHLMMTVAVMTGSRTEKLEAPAARPSAETQGRDFGKAATISHLLLAISVIFLFASSWWMLALPLPSAEFTYRAFPFQLHKNLGITLMFLLVLMLVSRFRRPPSPPAPRRLPQWMHRLSVADHVALYLLVTAVAISGYMSSSYSGWATTLWWLIDLPHWGHEDEALNMFWSDVHLWTCWALLAVLAAHVGRAAYHAFSADGFVRRMLRL